MAKFLNKSSVLGPEFANGSFVVTSNNNTNVSGGSSGVGNASFHLDPGTNQLKEDSPLKIFGLAKKKINDIFDEIYEHLLQSEDFLANEETVQLFTEPQRQEVRNFIEKTRNIKDILARNHMKVAFFGRTSNGKSTVINSVLHKNILPCGMGHTTNCFLQIEGIDASEPYYLLDGDPDNQLNIEDINLLANALDTENLGDDTLCKIYWPKHKCNLLKDEVVLVDSPGIDVSPNLDSWIDKYCLDADVFVLVSNSESTIMQAEKSFFHKVNQKISKPNIFILNNRWDVVAMEPESAKVKKQHTERSVAFLSEELMMSRSEAEERVFFVSAKEVLNSRLQGKQALNGSFREGHQQRYFEFENFERKFEECLSKSAIKTKFEHHTKCGKDIASELIRTLETSYATAVEQRDAKQTLRDEKQERLSFIMQQIELFTNEIKHLITNIVDKVENKVSMALNEEIKRLSILIKDFDQPFSDDKITLQAYKGKLHAYVETGLDSNLKARLNNTLKICVDTAREAMVDRVLAILPKSIDLNIEDFKAAANFTIFYQLNCKSLCSDFQEDLEFRFSYGFFNLIKSLNSGRLWLFGNSKKSRPAIGNHASLESSDYSKQNGDCDNGNDLVHLVERFSLLAPQSQTTVGSLAIGGFIVKAVGVRVLVITVGVYTLIYVYERMTWTNRKKEKVFKKQYVRHATEKLRLIVDLTSANCSHQIKQELTSICAKLGNLCDLVIKNLQTEIACLDTQIKELDRCIVTSRKLKNRAMYLRSELDTFFEKYLDHDV